MNYHWFEVVHSTLGEIGSSRVDLVDAKRIADAWRLKRKDFAGSISIFHCVEGIRDGGRKEVVRLPWARWDHGSWQDF